ncbi:MAG: DUF2938 family protein [Deltaproteobacteria bacterium]|nr:DUF2938 family protein [Deltaproteobacteria bacterium]MBT4640700.1 DUF2938 family protein [Deltaproteobacteria bacterium]MBT7152215.1 DUF2938 family protein [Deltaproteobacteria bacterium]
MIILEAILMGIFATFLMDVLAGFLAKKKLMFAFITPEEVGRWFLYIFRGKLVHEDIRKTPELKNEKLWCLGSHYLIGIALAGIYLFLDLNVSAIREQVWISLAFGIATVIFPWFWLLPSTGFGIMASKSNNRSLILRTNLINHTNFGLGLLIWVLFIHGFFI